MIERRIINNAVTRKASEPESRAIGGIAAMVNTPTVIWEDQWNGKREKFIEQIAPGAFDEVLDGDTRALVNHNDEKILGRTTSGTLKIFINSDGHLEYDVPEVPDTTYGNDLLVSVSRGDITQSSFAFRIKEKTDMVEEDEMERRFIRTITKMSELLDVSPVTYPAYEDTVTELRSKITEEVAQLRQAAEVIADDDLGTAPDPKVSYLKNRIKILAHRSA